MMKTMRDHPGPVYRCSFSFPPDLAQDVSYLAKRIGVSQSALLVELLTPAVSKLTELFRDLPDHPTPDQARRLRGRSVELVRDAVASAQSLVGDDVS